MVHKKSLAFKKNLLSELRKILDFTQGFGHALSIRQKKAGVDNGNSKEDTFFISTVLIKDQFSCQ